MIHFSLLYLFSLFHSLSLSLFFSLSSSLTDLLIPPSLSFSSDFYLSLYPFLSLSLTRVLFLSNLTCLLCLSLQLSLSLYLFLFFIFKSHSLSRFRDFLFEQLVRGKSKISLILALEKSFDKAAFPQDILI